MSRVSTSVTVPAESLGRFVEPRDGFVLERRVGVGRFEAAEGPLREYRRDVEVEDLPGGRARVRQTVEFRLAVPYFGFLFVPLVRRLLASSSPERVPWWAPPDRVDARGATVLATLALVSGVGGYLLTVLTQTIAFAAEEFGAGEGAQGAAGFAARLGGLLAFAVLAAADRVGRRRVVLGAAAAGAVATALGAVAPSLGWLAGTQVLGRGVAVGLLAAAAIVAAEEMPAGSRAYAVSVLTLAGSGGAGIAVAALPLADLSTGAWRILFALPLVGVLLLPGVARRLPESRRFLAPHAPVSLPSHGRRLLVLGAAALLFNVFSAPASFFQNRYLVSEHGFSATLVAVFTVVTATPGAIGLVVGGRLADTRGRRPVGALSLAGYAVAWGLFFASAGWLLWGTSIVAAVVGAASVPALGVYGPELFPTSLRGRAGGVLTIVGLAGSGIGLLVAGRVAESVGFAAAMLPLAAAPLAVAVLVLAAFPETAHRELEDINPEDRPPP